MKFGLTEFRALRTSMGKIKSKEIRVINLILAVMKVPNVVVQEAEEAIVAYIDEIAGYNIRAEELARLQESLEDSIVDGESVVMRLAEISKMFS